MIQERITLAHATPGARHQLQVWRFGQPGQGPKAYIQAALHADEVPALLVATELRALLEAREQAGDLAGEVVLVPFANPLGLAQHVLGQHHGRFDLRDGANFNRGYPELGPLVATALQTSGQPLSEASQDAAANVQRVREALRQAVGSLHSRNQSEDLKHQLLRLAADSDVVLDLHCDAEAVMHVYALTPQAEKAQQLSALLQARALLLATESGDSPFDEACSRPWLELQQRLAPAPLPLACFAATVELRGEADTNQTLARQDAEALMQFLQLQGVLRGAAFTPPEPLCQPTPLAGSEPITAPSAGVVVFHRQPGDVVAAGDRIADLIDPATGQVHPLHCRSAGVFYARCATRWASAGKRLGKVAGTVPVRSGRLLSP
jgi:predicted deacylase